MGQVLQDERIWIGEDELDRVVVHPFERHEIAAGLKPARLGRGQVVVQHVDVPELEVVGGVRMAVGPLGAAPQVQGEFPPVRADVIALDDVGHHRGEVRTNATDALLAHAGAAAVEGAGSRVADREHATVGAHFMPGLDNLRVQRQTFLNRRQITGGHPLGQQGRFLAHRLFGHGFFRHGSFGLSGRFFRRRTAAGDQHRPRGGSTGDSEHLAARKLTSHA